jgi:hypothetical protein
MYEKHSFMRGLAPARPDSWLSEAQESRSWSTTATRQVSAKEVARETSQEWYLI